MTPSASPRTRKFAAGQACGADVMLGPPTATGFPRARQRSTMSSVSPPCGSMPPVKTRSAQSRSSSVSSPVLRSTSRTDHELGRSAATVIRPSGGAAMLRADRLAGFLERPECVRLEARANRPDVAGLCIHHTFSLPRHAIHRHGGQVDEPAARDQRAFCGWGAASRGERANAPLSLTARLGSFPVPALTSPPFERDFKPHLYLTRYAARCRGAQIC